MSPLPVEPLRRWVPGVRAWTVIGLLFLAALLLGGLRLWRAQSAADAQQLEFHVYGRTTIAGGAPARFRVVVQDGERRLPVAGAAVRAVLEDRRGEGGVVPFPAVTTDRHGLAVLSRMMPAELPPGTHHLEVQVSRGADRADETLILTVKGAESDGKAAVVTDKPRYQPGQTIHMRSVALGGDQRPAAHAEVQFEVRDPRGNAVHQERATTSAFGIAALDFELADQVNLGDYTVAVTTPGGRAERQVTVASYALPRFKVTVTPDREAYEPGAPITGKVTARYTFGQPVVGAQVRLLAVSGAGKERPLGGGTTDQQGGYRFTIEGSGDQRIAALVAEVSGEGIGRQRGTAELSVVVMDSEIGGALRLAVVPETHPLVRGQRNAVFVVASYADGRPARALVKLRGDVSGERLTSDHGVARFTVVPDDVDTLLRLTAVATDQAGQWGRQKALLRVALQDAAFVVRTDRATYAPGEPIEVQVSARYPGLVHVDLERRGRVVGGATLVVHEGRGAATLPFPSSGDGPIFLNAYRVLTGGRLFEQSLMRHVRGRPALQVALSFPAASFRPGEPAPLSLQVTDPGGAPVQAAVSLAGIDDAVVRDYDRPPGAELAQLTPTTPAHATAVAQAVPSLLEVLRVAAPNAAQAEAQRAVLARGDARPAAHLWEEDPVQYYGHRTQIRGGELAKHRRWEHERDASDTREVAHQVVATLGILVLLVVGVLLAIYAVKVPRLGRTGALTHGARRRLIRWSRIQLGAWAASTAALGALIAAAVERGASWMLLLTWGLIVASVCWVLARTARLLGRSLAVEAFPTWRSLAWTLVGLHLTLHAAAISWVEIERGDDLYAALTILAGLAALITGLLAAWRRRALWQRAVLRGWGAFGGAVVLVLVLLAGASSLFQQLDVRFPDPLDHDEWLEAEQIAEDEADNREGGTGTRAKGEEGSMGNPNAKLRGNRYGVRGPADNEPGAGQGAAEPPPRMREYFPETLLWRPEVITDPAGRSTVEVALADSITTWQLSATAISAQGLLGAGTTQLRAFQEFFVDLELPRHLTVGDEMTVPVVVFNYLAEPQTVRLTLAPSAEVEILGDRTAELQIEAQASAAARFELRALAQGQGFLAVEARGDQLADAIKRPVEVHHDLHRLVQVFGGTIDGTREITFEVSDTTVVGTAEAWLKLYPSAFAQIAEGLRGVFTKPHGCFEQTSATTYPSVLALQVLRSLRKVSPELEREALGYLSQGYQRLLTFEVDGGGFSLFGRSPADLVLTAYGLMQFADMGRVRFVAPELIARTSAWLLRVGGGAWAREPTPLRVTAYVAWALRQAGASGPALDRALARIAKAPLERAEDPYELALCANALLSARLRTRARMALERLVELRKPAGAHWETTGRSLLYAGGRARTEETTALVALALLRGHHRLDLARDALDWLVEQRGQHGTWSATSSTVAAMRALLAGMGGKAGVTDAVTIQVNGTTVPAPAPAKAEPLAYVTVPFTDQLRPGTNQVALSSKEDGGLRYQVVSSRWVSWEDAPGHDPASPFSYAVQYAPVTVAPGESVRCQVTLGWKRKEPIKMPMVEVGIPPGTEVVRTSLDRLKRKGTIESYGIGPRHLVLYLPELSSAKRFDLSLRALQRGRVKAPASRAYPYYEPELVVETPPVPITIE